MCSDFLTRSYDIGGVVSVMALSSLFVLMTQHGLEYPNFYEKLYALLEPSIFMAKYRARFFQVLIISIIPYSSEMKFIGFFIYKFTCNWLFVSFYKSYLNDLIWWISRKQRSYC